MTSSNPCKVTLYVADGSFCNQKQTFFPFVHECSNESEFLRATMNDFTSIRYSDGRRLSSNFEAADCLIGDIDNTHSENCNEWLEPIDVADLLHGVPMYYHFSRSNMLPKNGMAPRTKFHFVIPTKPVFNELDFKRNWRLLKSVIPEIDSNTKDAGRFFFGGGTYNKGGFFSGTLDFNEFCELNEIEPVPEENFSLKSNFFKIDNHEDKVGNFVPDDLVIKSGSRNQTLFGYACMLYKKYIAYGNRDELIWQKLLELADKHCDPPFPHDELKTVIFSARRYAEFNRSQLLRLLDVNLKEEQELC